jgi:type IV pilus assembly protein PilC
MPTFQFEAMDATGAEIKDVIEAPTEEEAQATIRQMGYFVTKITAKKSRKKAEAGAGGKKKRGFVFGGVRSRDLTTFTRQLSILQDAGLPILRSLRILAGQARPGRLKYSLEDTCDEIEGGSTLSEGMAKSPKSSTACTST